MICPKCQYEWEPRKAAPKSCPRCKTRLDAPKKVKTQYTEEDVRQMDAGTCPGTENFKPFAPNPKSKPTEGLTFRCIEKKVE